MRPLILLSQLGTGGAERVTVGFVRRLAERGIVATTCTLTDRHDGPLAAELAAAGLPRIDLGARRLADWRLPPRFLRMARRGRFDLLHAHGQDAAILSLACLPLTPSLPRLITRHVLDEPADTRAQRLRRRLALTAFRLADLPIAVSTATADTLERLAHLPLHAVRVIRNGIDVAPFARASDEGAGARLRERLGIPASAPLALMLAVLRKGKGHDLLLDAWPSVLSALPGARLLIAGGGELEPALRERIDGSPLAETVRLLGPREDIPDLLAACDVAVLPSESEALPTVVMEAAAAGRPMIATDVGGTRDVLADGVTGRLLPARPDAAALAAALTGLLGDRERAALLGRAGRARAAREFSIDAQVDATLAAWRDVLAARARVPLH